MANEAHLRRLQSDTVENWNAWRSADRSIEPDLAGANLDGCDLAGVDFTAACLIATHLVSCNLENALLSGAKLDGAILRGANLRNCFLDAAILYAATLSGADLSGANLSNADFRRADLKGAVLTDAFMWATNLSDANLTGVDLSRSDLTQALLIGTDLQGANLASCRVYGASVWDTKLDSAIQSDLIITPHGASTITVDNLEVAQFIYLLVNNKSIRNVVHTITSKLVLILGRFTPARKAVLDAIRSEIRKHGRLPVLFDFEKPATRDLTETVSLLAHMASFIIADLTDARSIPQELMAIVPALPSVPVQPLILTDQREYAMFEHFRRFPWVLPTFLYEDEATLIAALYEKVIRPAELTIAQSART